MPIYITAKELTNNQINKDPRVKDVLEKGNQADRDLKRLAKEQEKLAKKMDSTRDKYLSLAKENGDEEKLKKLNDEYKQLGNEYDRVAREYDNTNKYVNTGFAKDLAKARLQVKKDAKKEG